jgi:hypothetical protein
MKFRTATIPTVHATQALEHLHAELGGKLLEAKQECAHLLESMQHVEAVLKLLQPGYNLARITVRRRKPNPWFKRGTVLRNVLEVLRTAESPMTCREIADKMLVTAGITEPDKAEHHKLVGSVSSAMISNRGRSFIMHNQGSPFRWSLKP